MSNEIEVSYQDQSGDTLFQLVEETEERDRTQYINIGLHGGMNYRLQISDDKVTVQVKLARGWTEAQNAGDAWNAKLTAMLLNTLWRQARHE